MTTPKDALVHKLPTFLDDIWSAEGAADVLLEGLAAAGYAVVPVEPTEAMIAAGDDALDTVYNGVKEDPQGMAFEGVWKAMVNAAKLENEK